jgi:Thiol-disulfide isomerase and thioredoxins
MLNSATARSLLVVLAAALIGFGAVYVTLGRPDNVETTAARTSVSGSSAAETPRQLPRGPGANDLSKGHMAAFVFKKEPEPLPDFKFFDGTGAERSLADWRGKVVLLNLWATWCAPCRKEMPALDRLQQALGSEHFEVVALSVDRGGAEVSRKFLNQIDVKALGLYVDPTTRATSQLKAVGLPVTILIDGDGREIGRLTGPAEWDSEDAKRLIRAVLGAGS